MRVSQAGLTCFTPGMLYHAWYALYILHYPCNLRHRILEYRLTSDMQMSIHVKGVDTVPS